ncbi:MAG: hypothetical protein LPK49_10805 [Bacteroidota bacterium]|nr:hypothetical protein [Bacteroidota bacterium]
MASIIFSLLIASSALAVLKALWNIFAQRGEHKDQLEEWKAFQKRYPGSKD